MTSSSLLATLLLLALYYPVSARLSPLPVLMPCVHAPLWPTHASLRRCSHLELSCSSPRASQVEDPALKSLLKRQGLASPGAKGKAGRSYPNPDPSPNPNPNPNPDPSPSPDPNPNPNPNQAGRDPRVRGAADDETKSTTTEVLLEPNP